MANKESVAQRLEKRRIEEWEIKNAADTLLRSEEIKSDKKLMDLVNKELDQRKKALSKLR